MRDRDISVTLNLMDREKKSERKSDNAETSSTNFKVTEKSCTQWPVTNLVCVFSKHRKVTSSVVTNIVNDLPFPEITVPLANSI